MGEEEDEVGEKGGEEEEKAEEKADEEGGEDEEEGEEQEEGVQGAGEEGEAEVVEKETCMGWHKSGGGCPSETPVVKKRRFCGKACTKQKCCREKKTSAVEKAAAEKEG